LKDEAIFVSMSFIGDGEEQGREWIPRPIKQPRWESMVSRQQVHVHQSNVSGQKRIGASQKLPIHWSFGDESVIFILAAIDVVPRLDTTFDKSVAERFSSNRRLKFP
jgi:hypothetical protein